MSSIKILKFHGYVCDFEKQTTNAARLSGLPESGEF